MKNQKEVLFSYFAYKQSMEIDPEKYSQASSVEDWQDLINSSPSDLEAIVKMASTLSDDDWESLDKEYTELTSAIKAKKGAKLKKLKKVSKKCSCGCDLVTKVSKGGIVEVCSCGCGGKINK